MVETPENPTGPKSHAWINRTVLGIVLATFLSDFGHEMCTAVLPLFLASAATVGTGALALGIIEGVADFLVSCSRLGGGLLGHYARRKQPWLVMGYAMTAICTSAIALVNSLPAMVGLRSLAWIGRGFRSPLRDDLLAGAVEPSHYGRAFGLERAGDMLGAMSGPLVALVLVGLGLPLAHVILVAAVPGLAAAAAMLFLVREKRSANTSTAAAPEPRARLALPGRYWIYLVGVATFGLGDFSRSFVVLLAAAALKEYELAPALGASLAVLVYIFHNLVSAVAAFPLGWLGDHFPQPRLLAVGYALGAATNLLLAWHSGSLVWLIVAVVGSGIYIAAEETLEKATAASLLAREQRSLGFGVLASANAVGDMASSIGIGWFLEHGQASTGFGIAALFGLAGAVWIACFVRPSVSEPPAA